MTYSALASRAALLHALEIYELSPRHYLGQNFLIDDTVVGHICELAHLSREDVVLEVGPGLGTLTCALLPRSAGVLAVEADRNLQPALEDLRAAFPGKLSLIMADALGVDDARLKQAVGELDFSASDMHNRHDLPTCWVSNLPYAVAATLILQYFQTLPSIRQAIVMVQSEVADRICARPDTKAYGAYTVKLSLYARVCGRFQVPPEAFFPAPHVESSVLRLERISGKLCEDAPASAQSAFLDEQAREQVCRLACAAFAQRRKTLRNSLKSVGVLSVERMEAAFAAAGINGSCRAETLSTEQFIDLARALQDHGVFLPDSRKR